MSEDSLVSRLLGLAMPPAVTEALLDIVPKAPAAPAGARLSVSAEQARLMARWPVDRAAYAASAVDHPEALAVFVKDSRVAVRHAAARNPALSAPQHLDMIRRAVTKDDAALLKVLLVNLPADATIAAMTDALGAAFKPDMFHDVPAAARVTAAHLADLLALAHPGLTHQVIAAVTAGHHDMSWSDAIAILKTRSAFESATVFAAAVEATYQSSSPISDEQARFVADALRSATPVRVGYLYADLSDTAAEILHRDGGVAARQLLAKSYRRVPDAIAALLVVDRDAIPFLPLPEIKREQLPALISTLLAAPELESMTANRRRPATEALLLSNHHLSVDEQTTLLRLHDMSVLRRRLTGAPARWTDTAEILSALLREPGHAFDTDITTPVEFFRLSLRLWYDTGTEIDLLEFLPGWLAAATSAGGEISDAALGHVVRSVTAALGDSPSVWEHVLALAGTWQGTLPELIETVRALGAM